MEQHGALQLGGPERAPFNGAYEDPRTTVAKQLNTELASPPGQALRWYELRVIRIYLRCGRCGCLMPNTNC